MDFHVQGEEHKIWRVRAALLSILAIYSTLHRLLIPMILKFTHLRSTSYAQLDLSVIFTWLLWNRIRKIQLEGTTSVLLGMNISFGGWDVYRTMMKQVDGWLAVSKLVSSVPILFVGLSALMVPEFKRKSVLVIVGVILGVSFNLLVHGV